jgi:hypothetical protein
MDFGGAIWLVAIGFGILALGAAIFLSSRQKRRSNRPGGETADELPLKAGDPRGKPRGM